MKLKDTSYDLFLKKNYFTKEAKIPLHVRYDFGYIVVAKYQNQNIGKFIDTKTVAREAVKKFKEGKVKELNKTKNWSNSVKRKNLISEQQRNDLLIKIDDLRKKLASDENDSLLAYKKIISDLNLAKRSNYKFNQMLEKEFSEYNKTIKDLNSFIEKNEVFVHATSLFLNEGKKYLNKNKKALNEIYSKTLIKSFYENIEICLSWCKNPVFLIQKEQLDELEIVKADFEDFKTKLIAYELQEKENLLEAERKSNENITGFLETNQERKKREDKLLNEFQNFKKLIEQCKTIQLIPEINLLNTHEWEETNIKLNTLDELTIEEYQIDKIKCNNSINELLTGLEEVKTRVLKPYEQIKKFLNSQHEKLLIIKGMAGTGKTECINKIIQYYWQKKPGDYKGNLSKNIIVCSPTTVGAANIRQKGFFNAQTLDYFLNKWETDHQLELFIVDEASMLTKNQLSRIKNKFHTNNSTKFVFIGDEGQFRPYDFNKGAESESYALNLNYSSKLFGSGFQIFLENDFRIKSYFSSEYYEFISSLRKDNIKSPLEALNNVLNNTNDIEVIQESNLIINFFNKYVHIGSSVRERFSTDSAKEILYYLKKKDEFNEMKFEDHAVLDAIELYRDQKTRRPELGKLYAQYYPKVEERLSKKDNLNTIISLFRSNVKADISNILIRPHIFGEGFKDNHPILKGEVMFIKQRKNSIIKNYLIKTELGVGDSFIVTKEPQPLKFKSIDKCALKEVIEDKVWLLEVKPVLKFSKGKLGTFLLNVVPEMFNLDTRKIVVWIGDLIELKSSNGELLEENDLNKIYNNVVSEIMNLELDENLHTKPITNEDIMQVARVKYDYARVSYASQGGEWDRVIIQLEDSWDDSRFLYTSFTRAVKKNYLFN